MTVRLDLRIDAALLDAADAAAASAGETIDGFFRRAAETLLRGGA